MAELDECPTEEQLKATWRLVIGAKITGMEPMENRFLIFTDSGFDLIVDFKQQAVILGVKRAN